MKGITREEEQQSADGMIACLLIKLGGRADLTALEVMSIVGLLKTGAWHIDGGELPNGNFQLILKDCFGKPVDVEYYLTVKDKAMKEVGITDDPVYPHARRENH